MAIIFKEIPIQDLCHRVTTGATPLRSRADYYDGGTIDWYKTGELKDWYLAPAEERINEKALSETSAKLFPADTVLMAMYGDGKTITSLGILRKPAATNQACSAMLVNDMKCNPRYFFYALKGRRDRLLKLASGGAQRNLSGKLIKEFSLPIPQLHFQQRIADILSAYDDLIENSQRRIKILESMARALYREWFVNFRFPGHEGHPRVASPLGEIPEGWSVRSLPECIHINPRVTVPRDGTKPFVSMGCLSNDSMLIADVESREGNSGSKFQNGDTLFARITPCLENGKTGFVQFLADKQAVAFGSTEFIVLRSRTLTPEFVYCLARSDGFRGTAIKSMSGASGRQRVQERCFDDFQITQPPRALLDLFSTTTAPSFLLIYKLYLQVQNLRRTRDLLLPRLLSGQIDVSAGLPEVNLGPPPVPTTTGDSTAETNHATAPTEAEPVPRDTQSAPAAGEMDREAVPITVRQVFSDGMARDHDTALRELAQALGYQRLGKRIKEGLSSALLTAVRRGILVNNQGAYTLGFRSLAECTRDSLKAYFLSTMGRGWITRTEAIQTFARCLGFARVGHVIEDTAHSLINGLIREQRLESDGPDRIRRT